MSARNHIPPRTREQQAKVSDPQVSAWVSANAGAGKTTVLARRVIRLLLAGNPPARILCLTFTKAAAAHMANKVLKTLGEWVRLDDAALDEAIREVSNLAPTPALRARARRLFAQALETPGGLKVQTIHAFCDRVLHQFPFEAGVPAGFEVLDEVQASALLDRARRAVLIEAARAPDGELGRALAIAVAAASDDGLDQALAEAVQERRKIERLIGNGEAALAAALGLRPDETVEAVETDMLASRDLPPDLWATAAEVLQTGAKTERELAERLTAASRARREERASAYLKVFLTQSGELRSRARFFTKGFGDAHPDLADRLDREFGRMAGLLDRLRAAQARERTAALLALAKETIDRYEDEKRGRGALDYADLIDKTAAMFDAYESSWVLYKLDGGIDHVLIDEAQDTSPEQWRVIAKLTEEFFAGRGARGDRSRTIFAVGDEKQSIFSFQGADPKAFDGMRRAFERRVRAAGEMFEHERLDLSFRSAPNVLKAVDTVFGRRDAFRGLSSEERETAHQAIRTKAPALVEIWPTEKPEAEDESAAAWDAPLDARRESSPAVRLAQRIANAVDFFWRGGGLAVGDGDKRRALKPGDVIVLVRRRGPLFDAILQALKRADVPVAGADRLELAAHIAVMDLMALGDALGLEADDLALACALKSPLFDLSEDDLYALAHGRRGTLAAALLQAKKDTRFAGAAAKFARWRAEAAALRPFDFYSRVLGRDGGRARMLARLGMEAADALDEFLARALAYERVETPTLTGFLSFLRRAGTEVKRDLEAESDAVRVMTVHGAKGLEAPLVILADTATIPDGRNTRLHGLPDSEAFVWAGNKKFDSPPERAARAAADELREAEYRRLLYVALTRAADALVVCGHEGRNELKEGCWYRLVRDALETDPAGLVETGVPYAAEKVLRWRPEPMGKIETPPAPAAKPAALEPWLMRDAPPPRPAPIRIAPSQLDPDDAPPSPYAPPAVGAPDPRRRGDLVHRLLQFLPQAPAAERAAAAARLLAATAPDLPADMRDALAWEAIRVIGHPELAELFGPQSRAEIDVIARTAEPCEIFGRIDRLAVGDDAVTIADFKTGAPPARAEDTPIHYVQQLALYCDALARVYPGKAMRALLVWTAGPAIHRIDTERLKAARLKLLQTTSAGRSP